MTAEQHLPEAPAFSVFSTGMKWFMVTLAGISAIFSPIRYVTDLCSPPGKVV
jgi:hypothetical protein